eukprot:1795873-Amphidinium_carterae.1
MKYMPNPSEEQLRGKGFQFKELLYSRMAKGIKLLHLLCIYKQRDVQAFVCHAIRCIHEL